jgi:hypothetical protein
MGVVSLMYRILVPIVVVAATWTSGPVHAADQAPNARLTFVEGSVMMNQGKQFVPAKPGTELIAGDRILALKTGRATVTFADGCEVLVKPGKLMTVTAKSVCSTGVAQGQGPNAEQEGLLGGDSVPGYGKPPNNDILVPALILGGIGAGIGISCLTENWPCDDNDHHHHRRSVSP